MKQEITLQIFASIRETLGRDTLTLSLVPPLTAKRIKEHITELHPQIAPSVKASRLSVNLEFVREDQELTLEATAELALIPPVSGG